MAQVQPSSDIARDQSVGFSNRLVWILNSHFEPYKDVFKTKTISIPPNSEKIPKHAFEGGNLMEYVASRRFLGAPKVLQEIDGKAMDLPKALRTVELTDSEYEKIVGKRGDRVLEAVKEEKKASRKLTAELKKVSNKVEAPEEL